MDPNGAELKPNQMRGERPEPEAREAEQGERPHGDEQKDQGYDPVAHQCIVSVATPAS